MRPFLWAPSRVQPHPVPWAPLWPSPLILLLKRPRPASVQRGFLFSAMPSSVTSKGQGAQGVGMGGGGCHIFVQVRLFQIHDLELQPLEDLFQGLAGLVAASHLGDETECRCACASVASTLRTCTHVRGGPLSGSMGPGQAREERPSRLPTARGTCLTSGDAHTSLWPSSACPRPPPGRSQLCPPPKGPRPFPDTPFKSRQSGVPEVRELLGKQSGRWSFQEALDQAVRLSVPNSGAARALKQAILEHSGMTHPEGRH